MNQQLICPETLKQLALGELSNIIISGEIFKPGKYGGVRLLDNTKVLKNTYRKRRITCLETLKTLPWGFSSQA